MFKVWKVSVLAVVMVATSMIALSSAEMWEPYQFQPKDQKYEYKIISFEDDVEKVSNYVLEIDKKDDGQLEISVKTTWVAAEEDLGSQILGGWWAAGAFGLTMAFINPMYAAFFGGLDMYEGNKMSFFGAGVVEVTGTEKVAGRKGFVCVFRNEDGGPVMGRYVVDPSLPLPLKTEIFEEDGTSQYQTELMNIEI
ncbi:hypothetical protein KAX22_02240 [bacterium]|nr:hypothetical protein [bacterium]